VAAQPNQQVLAVVPNDKTAAHQDHPAHPDCPVCPERMVHQASPEDLELQECRWQWTQEHPVASSALLDHPAHLDPMEDLDNQEPLANLEHQAKADKEDSLVHQDHPEMRDPMANPVNQDNQASPVHQDNPDTERQDKKDHPVRPDSQASQDNQADKPAPVNQDHPVHLDHQDNQVNPEATANQDSPEEQAFPAQMLPIAHAQADLEQPLPVMEPRRARVATTPAQLLPVMLEQLKQPPVVTENSDTVMHKYMLVGCHIHKAMYSTSAYIALFIHQYWRSSIYCSA